MDRQTDSSVDYGVSARSRLPTLSTASVLENQHFPSETWPSIKNRMTRLNQSEHASRLLKLIRTKPTSKDKKRIEKKHVKKFCRLLQ